MKTCFSEGKRMKQFGTPQFLREPPPPRYTHTHPHTHTLNFRGEETMALGSCINW